MKNSNKKIETLNVPYFYRDVEDGDDIGHIVSRMGHIVDDIVHKQNETIDKVNELEERFEFSFEQLSTVLRTLAEAGERNTKLIGSIKDKCFKRRDKLESKPEECKHLATNLYLDGRDAECRDCGMKQKNFNKKKEPKKKVFYTSEGDAVGEVEKKCEHNEFNNVTYITGTKGTCVKCGDTAFIINGYEPKKD